MTAVKSATGAAHLADAAIGIASHLSAELDEALAPHRLTRPSYLVLEALADAEDGALAQRVLIARVRRTAGAMSVRLARMERAGAIARAPDPDSRRSTIVSITDRGRELLDAARPAYESRAERLMEGLSDSGRSALAKQLPAWLAFFEPDERTAPRLGVAVAPAAIASRMRTAVGLPEEPGVLVLRVGSESRAARGGVLRGDLIRAAGGAAVTGVGDLERAVRTAKDAVELEVLRGSEPVKLSVALG
ncbi:MAG TPA: MarR family transcriptional regulator [Solirubrobacteraceae bacterium]|jgi:DNA-binding MarR family transcriptional regulator|nr:MarR family transcriptional regulator [Solirubrobacteraceae bacterium]